MYDCPYCGDETYKDCEICEGLGYVDLDTEFAIRLYEASTGHSDKVHRYINSIKEVLEEYKGEL